MNNPFFWWLRGVGYLRYPELIRGLGELKQEWAELEELRKSQPQSIIHRDVVVQGWRKGEVTIGKGVRIEKGTIICLGDDFNGYGSITFEENTWVGQYNNFRLGRGSIIRIGKGCLISQFCSFVGSNHQLRKDTEMRKQPTDEDKVNIVVGDDVWFGAGSSVMPSVSIGKGAVIGANSVVTKTVPEYEIWAGSPARKIGARD